MRDEPALALELQGIRKEFRSEGTTVVALDGARLAVRSGEIHALLGENGAGKSTLVAIAAGRLQAQSGTLRRRGQPVRFESPLAALRAGVALVPQHDLLVEAATVADNLARLDPAAPFLEGRRARRERVRRLASALELDLGDPDARVSELPVGTRQRIEVAGSLQGDPDVLILDEPTAVLSPDETRALFTALRRRATTGGAVVLITHRISETFSAADRVTVLANGRNVLESPIQAVTPEDLAHRLIVASGAASREAGAGGGAPGTEEGSDAPASLEASEVVPEGWRGESVSLRVRRRELLTLLAIDGNGADVLGSALAGVHGARGRLHVGGVTVPCGNAVAYRRAGGAFVPRDRRREGLFPDLSLAENLALGGRLAGGGFWLDRREIEGDAAALLSRFNVKASSPRARARELSGGNQQKLVLARELSRSPRALVAIHPTRGLDVGAAAELRGRLVEAARAGCGVLVVTADPEEAQLLGGPIRVVYRDRLSEPLPPATGLEELLRRMGGLT